MYQDTICQTEKSASIKVDDSAPSDEGPAFPPLSDPRGPEVVGDPKFQDRIREALSLLKSRDRHSYDIVSGYVGRIEQAAHSGMRATANPPTFFMSDSSALHSVTWAAASIAHDAYHSKLYFDFRGAHPGSPVPRAIWTGTAAEVKCNKFQLASMRRIGAPQSQIDHALINSDGHYIGQERSKRTW